MTYDALVIGAGPAGLAAAVQLARLRRTCLVVDDAAGRSLWSQVTRNHLGFPDGVSATDLRLLGQRQAVTYGASLREGTVTRLRRARGRRHAFEATVVPRREPEDEVEEAASPGLADNRRRETRHGRAIGEERTRDTTTIRARTVLVATGVTDMFPAFEGRDECVGISLFWCIVCDGFEATDRTVAVVGDDEDGLSTALGLLRFTERVSLVTGGRRTRAPARRLDALARRGVEVHRGRVSRYVQLDGMIERLVLDDGSAIECEMVFVSAPKRPRSALARRLRAGTDRFGYLEIDKDGRASVAGLYAAGDVTAGHAHQVTTAAHQGATAATAINYDLYALDD
jgi:thioredoxin reductase (NADPH)